MSQIYIKSCWLPDNESFLDRASDFSYVTGLKGEKYFFKKNLEYFLIVTNVCFFSDLFQFLCCWRKVLPHFSPMWVTLCVLPKSSSAA